MSSNDSQRRMSRREAAEALGITVRRLDQLRQEGMLRSERNMFTRRVVIESRDVESLQKVRGAILGRHRAE